MMSPTLNSSLMDFFLIFNNRNIKEITHWKPKIQNPLPVYRQGSFSVYATFPSGISWFQGIFWLMLLVNINPKSLPFCLIYYFYKVRFQLFLDTFPFCVPTMNHRGPRIKILKNPAQFFIFRAESAPNQKNSSQICIHKSPCWLMKTGL